MSVRAVTIQDIVGGTSELPVFGEAAARLIRATGNDDTSPAQVAELLSGDQSLTMRVLRLANSAYFGLPRRIDSVAQAVLVLGLRRVRHITLAASSYSWLQRPLGGYFVGPRDLWLHSISTAQWGRELAERSGICDPESAFTAGLIHDIGKVALCAWHEERMKAIIRFAQRQNMSYDEAERRVFGFDHAEVGAKLCEAWNLPPVLVDAVRWHHRPSEPKPEVPLASCINAALTMVALGGKSIDQPPIAEDQAEASLNLLCLSMEEAKAWQPAVSNSIDEMEGALAPAA
jgi:putative nucleotidyltransferase with HDIG domain